ncbi:hypothetical protein RvY_13348-3 [Ramazzottius varieornatus]|uniref:Receptor ligand binding region domain-containing protein n=1 Tax=Ramazzottius varieornatus TaxID=947166 RepID=A0A1D1VMI4_RAMVA|nr:hypothetical protein RvY_13348-3 [Ramazzottius varieornatus]
MAFEAFRSLITYVNVEPDWNKTADWVEGIAETARVSFNTTYTEDQKYNEYALSAYEVMLASAQVFQENINATSMDGRQYAKYFWNRVFQFPSRNMTIGPYGMRADNVVFFRLNASSGELEETWRYDAVEKLLKNSSSLASYWPMTGGIPPPDHPACGFSGSQCDSTGDAMDCIQIFPGGYCKPTTSPFRWQQRARQCTGGNRGPEILRKQSKRLERFLQLFPHRSCRNKERGSSLYACLSGEMDESNHTALFDTTATQEMRSPRTYLKFSMTRLSYRSLSCRTEQTNHS